MAIQRMDNVGTVVDDLDAAVAVAYFTELGMEMEGRMPIGGLYLAPPGCLPRDRESFSVLWSRK